VADAIYETTRISELERDNGWSPIRRHLNVSAFGVNAWTKHEAGATVIPEHDERPSGHEELYLVLAGHAVFTVATDEIDAPAGTIVFVRDPLAQRGAVARAPDTSVLVVGGPPGQAYKPRSWEANSDVIELFDRGLHEQAKQVLTEALDRYEDRATILYNLACAEAQLGDVDAALEYLRAGLRERPDLAGTAREDSDLEPIRADPRFAGIVAVA
jgi:tetratricopeptide (TPR) repeat protein